VKKNKVPETDKLSLLSNLPASPGGKGGAYHREKKLAELREEEKRERKKNGFEGKK